jgi:hypothetical protein
LILRFDGAILSQEWEEAAWDKFVTYEPDQIFIRGMKILAIGHNHARRQSSNTAIASFARGTGPGTGDQSQDCSEVAQARDG